MKKTTIYFTFAFLFIALASCNKYEEGANFSFISKKVRVVNTWVQVATSITDNNGNTSSNTGYTEIEVTFDKDMNYAYTGKILGFPFSQSGTWSFNSDKTGINLSRN